MANLVGFDNFKRVNPMSDKINVKSFHHMEFYCADATMMSRRFMGAMGVELAAKSDLSTGNDVHASYLMQSSQVRYLFTAPYHSAGTVKPEEHPFPFFNPEKAGKFFIKHGFACYAVAVIVEDVQSTYQTMMANGGISVLAPIVIKDKDPARGWVEVAEIHMYGDVSMRLVDNKNFTGTFWPNFVDVVEPNKATKLGKYGIDRIDHIVGNVPSLKDTMTYLKNMTGFHEFAEFTAEDVGTIDSGLNSCVLANNNEMVLLPVNEPTFGTRRKSQIQTYLEQNEGAGVQHVALFSSDIFRTLELMMDASNWGGFEFMPGQGPDYYERTRAKIGNAITEEQYVLSEKLGVLIDKDDQGVLLQIFTKPLGDRPTIFFEIIQRVGCMVDAVQKPGCGGFGKGNFKDLFKSIEKYEGDLGIN